MDQSRFVYLNGSFVPREEAKISLFDRGLLLGDGLFETMRAYHGQVFRFDRHFERLRRSIEFLKIPFSSSKEAVRGALDQLLEANQLQDAYIRLMVWRGEGVGLDPETCSSSKLAIIARSFAPYSSELYEYGMKGGIVSIRQNEWSPLSRMKSLNFLPNIVAKMEAKAKGADEGILLNTKGSVAEGTVSNLFLVLKGQLLTPSLESGVLPGITREAVLELAKGEGINAIEREIALSELMSSEEVFLTNTLMEVMPMTSIDGLPIGGGRPGPITKRLANAYQELVAKETKSVRASSTRAP